MQGRANEGATEALGQYVRFNAIGIVDMPEGEGEGGRLLACDFVIWENRIPALERKVEGQPL